MCVPFPHGQSQLRYTRNATLCHYEGNDTPDEHKNDRTDQCPDQRDTRDVDITNTLDDNDLGYQPDSNERCDDGTNNPDGMLILHDELCDQANDGRYNEVQDRAEDDRPRGCVDFDRDVVCKYCKEV